MAPADPWFFNINLTLHFSIYFSKLNLDLNLDAKFSLSPYKMYGAYWSNAEQKVQVPSASQLENPGSALPGMPSACCIDIRAAHYPGTAHKSFPYKLPISPA